MRYNYFRVKINPKSRYFESALRIKCAELWFKLGERGQALMELKALPKSFWDDPTVTGLLRLVCRL